MPFQIYGSPSQQQVLQFRLHALVVTNATIVVEESKSLSGGAVAGIAVGSFAAGAILVVVMLAAWHSASVSRPASTPTAGVICVEFCCHQCVCFQALRLMRRSLARPRQWSFILWRPPLVSVKRQSRRRPPHSQRLLMLCERVYRKTVRQSVVNKLWWEKHFIGQAQVSSFQSRRGSTC